MPQHRQPTLGPPFPITFGHAEISQSEATRLSQPPLVLDPLRHTFLVSAGVLIGTRQTGTSASGHRLEGRADATDAEHVRVAGDARWRAGDDDR
jgi:hypothetical protein